MDIGRWQLGAALSAEWSKSTDDFSGINLNEITFQLIMLETFLSLYRTSILADGYNGLRRYNVGRSPIRIEDHSVEKDVIAD